LKIPAEPQKNAFIPKKTAENTGKVVRVPANITNTADAATKPVAATGKPALLPGNAAASLANLLSALKLPHDNLSRSIIAFARFFSLPLEPKFLNSLRRDVLSLPDKGMALREAAVLGSAAAADKGLKLGKKALGEYAAAIEGSLKSFIGKSTEEPEINRQINDREDGEQQKQDTSQNPKGGGSFSENEHRKDNDRQKDTANGNLKRQVTEILNEKPLLDLINRIPGKKGRWIVIPFSYNQDGFELNVSLRILLYENNISFAESVIIERLTADINIKRAGENITDLAGAEKQRRWIISLEKPKLALADKAVLTGCRVSVFSETAANSLSEKKRLKRDLAKALNIPLDGVEIMEKPLLYADSREDHLRSVYEEV